MNIDKLKTESQKIKHNLFKKFIEIKEGHPGSILSIFDIVSCLYLGNFIHCKKNLKKNDYFIMSKGHAGSVQYPFLIRKNILKKKDWISWKRGSNSILKIFPNLNIPGVDFTSGSLGHGLGIASGLAIADRSDRIKKNIWTFISEGELYEGSIWESLLFIKHHNLHNIKIILDQNDLIILGKTKNCLKLDPIETKLKGFGFDVFQINGHNYKEIVPALKFLKKDDKKNKIVLAKTIKGNSIKLMENKPEWHYWQNLSLMKEKELLKELKK